MVKISLSSTGALVTAPNGRFPKLAELPQLRVLWVHEALRLQAEKRRVPVLGRCPTVQP